MEKFDIKINRIYQTGKDNKHMIVFDVYIGDTKVGESEAEYAVFYGVMLGKFQENIVNTNFNTLSSLLAK